MIGNHRKKIDRLENDKEKEWSIIMGNLYLESQDVLRRPEGFKDLVDVAYGPLKLMETIKSTHMTGGSSDQMENQVADHV